MIAAAKHNFMAGWVEATPPPPPAHVVVGAAVERVAELSDVPRTSDRPGQQGRADAASTTKPGTRSS